MISVERGGVAVGVVHVRVVSLVEPLREEDIEGGGRSHEQHERERHIHNHKPRHPTQHIDRLPRVRMDDGSHILIGLSKFVKLAFRHH